MTKPNREFCSDHCRAMFHHNKAGYGKLREFMPKMIAREVREQLAELRAVIVADVVKQLANPEPVERPSTTCRVDL